VTAERFTRGWVRTYTRGLSDEVRTARCEEIDSDLHEHRTTGAHGAAIVGRTLRGVPADVSWRREERRAVEAINGRLTGVRALWATATQTWFAPFAVLIAVFNVLLAIWIITDKNSSMPGQAIGPVIVLSLTVALFAGLSLRWRSGRPVSIPDEHTTEPPRSTARHRLALGALAALAVVAVMVGAVAVFATAILAFGVVAAITARRRIGSRPLARTRSLRAEHVMLADVLIIIGTLPALGMFWLVIPAILALLVIGGVLGTGPGTRRRAAEAV
jgi:hypothetical protein